MSVTPVELPNRAGRRAIARNRGGALGAAGVLAVGSAGALLAAFAGSAGAASTLIVDSNADGAATAANCTDGTPGNCTLRDAAAQANNGDTINFDAGITSITLTGGTVDFDAVNIIGPGSANLTVTTTVYAGAYESFYFGGTGDVTISGITITKNRIAARHEGNLTLDDVTITESTGLSGGALYANNNGELDINDSNFDNNTSFRNGGALYANNDGAITITGSTFTGNDAAGGSGGGLKISGTGVTTITRTNISGNSSRRSGGGLNVGYYYERGGSLVIDSSTVSGNTAGQEGGGLELYNIDGLTMLNSTISGNTAGQDGGGLELYNIGGFTMLNSTISGNTAGQDGGGLRLEYIGDALIANSTMADNAGDADEGRGSALYFANYLNGDVQILFTTISGNSAGADTLRISRFNGFSMDLTGTIITDNTTSTGTGTLATDITSLDMPSGLLTLTNSLVMGVINAGGEVDGGGNLFGVSALLGALADNGGATKTMALLTGSPAIDAGPLTWTAFDGDGFDQRATPFLRVYGTSADMGAYEVQPDPEPEPEPTTTTTTVGIDPVVPAFTG